MSRVCFLVALAGACAPGISQLPSPSSVKPITFSSCLERYGRECAYRRVTRRPLPRAAIATIYNNTFARKKFCGDRLRVDALIIESRPTPITHLPELPNQAAFIAFARRTNSPVRYLSIRSTATYQTGSGLAFDVSCRWGVWNRERGRLVFAGTAHGLLVETPDRFVILRAFSIHARAITQGRSRSDQPDIAPS